ncbi:MAG: hypothetical protein AVDCRST_MAG19-4554, partial [uncultured Thermomicrobiales bacterium]
GDDNGRLGAPRGHGQRGSPPLRGGGIGPARDPAPRLSRVLVRLGTTDPDAGRRRVPGRRTGPPGLQPVGEAGRGRAVPDRDGHRRRGRPRPAPRRGAGGDRRPRLGRHHRLVPGDEAAGARGAARGRQRAAPGDPGPGAPSPQSACAVVVRLRVPDSRAPGGALPRQRLLGDAPHLAPPAGPAGRVRGGRDPALRRGDRPAGGPHRRDELLPRRLPAPAARGAGGDPDRLPDPGRLGDTRRLPLDPAHPRVGAMGAGPPHRLPAGGKPLGAAGRAGPPERPAAWVSGCV